MTTATATRVPNAPFRERFEQLKARGYSVADVALWLGWYRSDTKMPDNSRVMRTLGLAPWPSGSKGGWYYADTVSYERAVELCDALGLDPHECGV